MLGLEQECVGARRLQHDDGADERQRPRLHELAHQQHPVLRRRGRSIGADHSEHSQQHHSAISDQSTDCSIANGNVGCWLLVAGWLVGSVMVNNSTCTATTNCPSIPLSKPVTCCALACSVFYLPCGAVLCYAVLLC